MHPEALGASFEQESLEPLASFTARVTGNVIFGGFQGDDVLGTAGFMAETSLKRAHKGHLWGMYVRQPARGTGLARDLVQAVLDHAQGRVELIQLSVVAASTAAHRLYTSMGFQPFGTEKRALKVDGRYFDEIHMAKPLIGDD
jgi:RimJ/RimL family protein N-acetyltransferase